jgi:hypothetical protein
MEEVNMKTWYMKKVKHEKAQRSINSPVIIPWREISGEVTWVVTTWLLLAAATTHLSRHTWWWYGPRGRHWLVLMKLQFSCKPLCIVWILQYTSASLPRFTQMRRTVMACQNSAIHSETLYSSIPVIFTSPIIIVIFVIFHSRGYYRNGFATIFGVFQILGGGGKLNLIFFHCKSYFTLNLNYRSEIITKVM